MKNIFIGMIALAAMTGFAQENSKYNCHEASKILAQPSENTYSIFIMNTYSRETQSLLLSDRVVFFPKNNGESNAGIWDYLLVKTLNINTDKPTYLSGVASLDSYRDDSRCTLSEIILPRYANDYTVEIVSRDEIKLHDFLSENTIVILKRVHSKRLSSE